MKKGSVIIDLSIDQGGCIETSEYRTLQDAAYTKHNVIHYTGTQSSFTSGPHRIDSAEQYSFTHSGDSWQFRRI